ncbi:hypothetical protein MHBO_000761 [Bonamia ostreae]|uniref:Hexose transporter 1 n=1 Tax=Bonamia ostreae TaxID=126728 RepID=A0ABV2AGR9_9EUKA
MVLKKFKRIKGITLNGLIIVIICGAIFGYGTGVISNVTSSFLGPNKSNMTLEDTVMTSSVLLGAFFGSLMSGAISDKIGRRNTLLVGAAIAIAGNTICMLAFGNYIVMAIGRFVFGLALGPISSVGPLYLSECVADDMRGFLGTFFQFSITFSIFLGVLWGFGAFKPNFWYIELGFSFLVILVYLLAIPLFVYTFFSPDTPRFLVDRDNEKAKELFMQFMTEEEAMAEMNTIREKRKVKSTWGQLFAKQNSRAIMIGLVLAAAQQLTGINAIIYYFNAVGEIIFQSNTTAIAAVLSGTFRPSRE